MQENWIAYVSTHFVAKDLFVYYVTFKVLRNNNLNLSITIFWTFNVTYKYV